MAEKKIFSRSRWISVHLLLLAAVVIAGWFITDYLGERARREIFEESEATTLLLTTHLTQELKKIEGAVKAMAGSPWIISALNSRRDGDIVRANSALDRYNSALDVSVSYIMNVEGITIASSNRNDPDSFVGKSYHFRPYFTQAVAGNPGRYFGLGITSLKRGFYASFPVKGFEGEIIGVVVMKKDLDGTEIQLRNYPYCFFVNKNGVIFLSSDSGLVMKSLWPLSRETEKELLASKQFGEKPFDVILQREVTDRAEVILHGNTYFASRRVMYPEGWSIVLMSSTARVTIYKAVGVILTIVASFLIMIPLVITYKTVSSAEAVRRSEERFEQVAQSSRDWIWETDREGRYTYSSRAVKQILGYGPEEMIGRHYYDFYVPDEREGLKETFKGFFGRNESFFRIVNKRIHQDGHHVFVESTGVPLTNEAGKTVGYRGTNRDITDSKRGEEMLEESEQRLHRIIQCSPIPIFVIGRDHRVIYWNAALEEFSGIKAVEVVGTKEHWRAFYNQERPCMADLLVDETTDIISQWYSGKFVRSNLLAEAYEATDFFPDIREGGKWLHFTAACIRDSQGNLVGAIETLEDITERKKAEDEKEKLERGLIQAQKMEAIGTLAGGVAHDFNNLLMGIQGYASLMLLTTDENNLNYRKLKSIEEQVKSGADLTAQLLGFARGGRYEVKPVDLNALMKSTAGMFGRTKKEITVHYKFREDLWPVEADRGQIEQVLLNLYVNAWQAMPKGGDLYLETDNVNLDETYVKQFSVIPGRYVKVSVTDTGVGMDEKTQQRIFEPFFTTKEMGRGTGLGLASAYGIIKGHRGIINVYSEKGHGTTFNIYLPNTEREVREERIVSKTLPKGHEAILLVDDEEVVIAVTEEILKSLGYQVLTARSGHEAIEKYKANWEGISLVILDMVMPEMGGSETFEGLKEINPEVKAILSSGYSLNSQAIRIMEKGCYAFIQKPFTISSLAQKIRKVLDGHLDV